MNAPSRVNRGPAAAAQNRVALMQAAREVFAHNGPHVPLALIWDTANVSPGVFYRHFPGRESLTRALLDEDFERLEAFAGGSECTLHALLDRVIDQTVDCAGLLGTLEPDSDDVRTTHNRLRSLIADKLATGDHGDFGPRITADRLMLAIGLIAGLLTKTPEPYRRRAAADSWQLLLDGLR